MYKLAIPSLFTLGLLATFSTQAHADGWKLLPVLEDDYVADIAVAGVIGVQHVVDNDDGQALAYGAELSLNCPLLRPANHTIRQRLSITNHEKDNLSLLAIELNPHHMFEVIDALSVGAGPSLGLTVIGVGDNTDIVFTYGLGGSARYDVSEKIFVGAEVRFAWTTEADFGLGAGTDVNNGRVLAKIGYQL